MLEIQWRTRQIGGNEGKEEKKETSKQAEDLDHVKKTEAVTKNKQ